MQFPAEMLKVGRIIKTGDPEFMLLEISKKDLAQFTIQPGDEFMMVVFVRQGPQPGSVIIWDPFE